MQINNDSINNLANGLVAGDATNMAQSAIMVDGVRYARALPSTFNKTTTSGACTCYLTDDGTITGNALYTTLTSVSITANNLSTIPTTSFSLSGVTLTASMSQPTFNGVTVLGISVLGSMTIAAVPNGTSIKIIVQGVGNAI